MRCLPPHHVPGPRLTDRCANHHVVVIEAAGGYGKTTLGAELVDKWRAVGIDVLLDHDAINAALPSPGSMPPLYGLASPKRERPRRPVAGTPPRRPKP